MKLSRQHSSESRRSQSQGSLHHLTSLHITTPTVEQSLLQIHHQQGWEQFFKHKIMDSTVPSVTSPDPSVMLEGTKWLSPQPGHVNALKSTLLIGLRFTLEIDHKSLVPVLTSTDLSKMPLKYSAFAFEWCNTTQKFCTSLANVKFQLTHFHMLQLTLWIHLTYSSQKKLKPLLAPQWINLLPLLSEIIEAQRWHMRASQRVLPSGLARMHVPSTPTQAILGKQSSLSSCWRSSPLWWTHCNPTSSKIEHTRLHPSWSHWH